MPPSPFFCYFIIILFQFTYSAPITPDETDPNHVNAVFRFLDERPDLITTIAIQTEKQITKKTKKGCLQYDYVAFRWLSNPEWNPFPNLTNGVPRCTELDCDNVFGPAKSVSCYKWFG